MNSLPIFRKSLTVSFSTIVFSLVITILVSCSNSDSSNNPRSGTIEQFVIQCESQCDSISSKIAALGGTVDIRYDNVNALAISIPIDIIEKIQILAGLKAIARDRIVRAPVPAIQKSVTLPSATQSIIYQASELNPFLASVPANYNFNNQLNGATQLHLNDQTGSGVVVAIIDSGTANNVDIVPSLAGSVIGGENFVEGTVEPSATSTLNDPHGTWVGGMIASHITLVVPTDDILVQSLLVHSPQSVLPNPNDATTSLVPVIGTAPEASLYPLKVFSADGSGAPSSRIILAMDRVITLKQNFDNNQPVTPVSGDGSEENPFVYDSLNIQVVNMSLGGPTLFPGLNVEDILTRKMLKSGIAVVTAAGNEGAAALTSSSPSTGVGSLSIGAASTPVHERVFRDVQSGAGTGLDFRPDDNIQVAIFSSRGPVADGRSGVDLITNGFASFTQGSDGGFSFISGTSFSTPTVTGAAALLIGAIPDSEAEDVHQALVMSANPAILSRNADKIDQGNGYLDIPAALDLLAKELDADIPKLPKLGKKPTKVTDNINIQDLNAIDFDDGNYSTMVDLLPGQVSHIFVPTSADTEKLVVTLNEITPELPVAEQNQIFGDDILLTIIDAPTSINDILYDDFVSLDEIIELPFPQQGLVRIAVMGDWTNAGKISAKISIAETTRQLSRPIATGELEDQDIDTFTLEIDDDTKQIVFELFWKNNWSTFPAHDIDLYLEDPQGNLIFDGATLRSPERVVIDNPMPGQWTAIVEGFSLHGFEDKYTLHATDGTGQRLNQAD